VAAGYVLVGVCGTPYKPAKRGTGGKVFEFLGILNCRKKLAEREGFEPSVEVSPHTRLAGEHLQPLGHLSAGAYVGLPAKKSQYLYELSQ
jgi:hypothetical protein